MSQEYKIWIGGKWRTTPEKWIVVNPYNREEVGITYLASRSDIDEALSAAVLAFQTMRTLPSHKRAEALFKISNGLQEQADRFSRMITLESGKPIADAKVEVGRAIHTFRIASEEAKRMDGDLIPLDGSPGSEGRLGLTRRVPIGPIVGITPFNFPLNLVAHKVAPAIASGNVILLKPAPQTPLTALLLAEIISTSGLPDGAVQVFPTTNPLAEEMLSDPMIAMLSFTGSAKVGWRLKEKMNKKRVVLELGGNAGVIIHSDADLDYAALRCRIGGFAFSGQVCISVQRIYVQEDCYQPFLDRFLPQVAALKSGDPLNQETRLGPLISVDAAQRVAQWIEQAVSAGAQVLTGGKQSGPWIEPTVLAHTTQAMAVNCEELFAPVVTCTPYRHFEEAIAAVNQSPYGLQAGLFTQNIKNIFSAFEQIDVGGLIINDVPTYRNDAMPYGGMKESGWGREGIRYAMDEMTELKLLVMKPY